MYTTQAATNKRSNTIGSPPKVEGKQIGSIALMTNEIDKVNSKVINLYVEVDSLYERLIGPISESMPNSNQTVPAPTSDVSALAFSIENLQTYINRLEDSIARLKSL